MALRTARGFAILALAALGACGGSGGGGGGGPIVVVLGDETFDGTYFALLVTGRDTGAVDSLTSTGTLTADGTGLASHTFLTNDFGTVSGPTTTPYEYDVAADGSLELRVVGSAFARGGISSDGVCALTASIFPGAFPGLLVLGRRDGFYTPASLSGAYYFAFFQTATLGGNTSTLTGNAVFDGVGTIDLTVNANTMGTILASGALTVGYTVIGDGTSVFSPGVSDLRGGVVAGGQMAIWAGGTLAGEFPSIAVVLKGATSAGVATFQGDYWIVCLARDPVSGDFRSFHGTATANGAGSVTLTTTANTEGTIAAQPPQVTTYSVAANGKFTVDAGGNVLQGGISQDGKYGLLGGGTVAGSEPTICLLLKK